MSMGSDEIGQLSIWAGAVTQKLPENGKNPKKKKKKKKNKKKKEKNYSNKKTKQSGLTEKQIDDRWTNRPTKRAIESRTSD